MGSLVLRTWCSVIGQRLSASAGDADTQPQETVLLVPNRIHVLHEAIDQILDEVAKIDYAQHDREAIHLALVEAMLNAYRHGNRCHPERFIAVRYLVDADKVQVEIEDEGAGFDVKGVADPTAPGNVERPHGRGILLMRLHMDEVRYGGDGNRVRMVRRNRARAS